MPLNQNDRKIFQDKGILHLSRFVSKPLVANAQKSILSELERLKLRGKEKNLRAKLLSLPFFQQITTLSRMVQTGPELDTLFSHELIQIMIDLAEANLTPLTPHPQLLLSLPQKEKWSIKNLNWHLDLAVPKKNELSGIQAFILLDDVHPKGGATLALAGSHRLHYLPQAKNGNAHTVLRQDNFFSNLFTANEKSEEELLRPHTVHGIEVAVIEMSGKAGDVFLMDLRTLHSPSINATKNLRMMATNRYVKI